jgi:hypothetical protein
VLPCQFCEVKEEAYWPSDERKLSSGGTWPRRVLLHRLLSDRLDLMIESYDFLQPAGIQELIGEGWSKLGLNLEPFNFVGAMHAIQNL